MISGKIILKSATKVTLDKRFGEIAKQAPPAPAPRIQQQANVIIPYSRQELFGNKRPAALSIAARLKKRSINYRLGLGANNNVNRGYVVPAKPRVFQRLSFANRRRGGVAGGAGAGGYLFGGQSGMGIRLRGQGRIGGTRTFRSRTRGYLNNNAVTRLGGYSTRGNKSKTVREGAGGAGRRGANNMTMTYTRSNRGRGGPAGNRGRGSRRNNNTTNRNVTKEGLDSDLDKYMAQTKLENDSIEMNAV